MTKTNIAITEHEDKTSQGGKDYTRFKTNNGWMSCFEKDVIAKCKENEGKIVSVEIAESEKNGRTFSNIRGFYEVVSEATEQIEKTPIKPQEFTDSINLMPNYIERKSVKGTAYEKDPVGLAVEVFNTIVSRLDKVFTFNDAEGAMDTSVKLVKQAQKAFS